MPCRGRVGGDVPVLLVELVLRDELLLRLHELGEQLGVVHGWWLG